MSHGFSRISTDEAQPSGLNSLVMNFPPRLIHSQLTDKIIGVFYDVYNELGYGFLESTYAEAMVIAFGRSRAEGRAGGSSARLVPRQESRPIFCRFPD